MPLEMGSQAVPTSQRTVTGAGCALLSGSGCADKGSLSSVCIAGGVIGRVVDLGITDAANMGAAMAPAAADTVLRYLDENGKKPADFDLIVTGDLGFEGVNFGESLIHGIKSSKAGFLDASVHGRQGNLVAKLRGAAVDVR